MSNRTILEINHDFYQRIEMHPQMLVDYLLAYLRSASIESRVKLEHAGLGVAVLATVHHTTDVRVSFDKAT